MFKGSDVIIFLICSFSRSIVAVPTCQCLIQLQTGRHYLISVRAVNVGGPSDRSEVITIATKGKHFKGGKECWHITTT